ncbi:hypothetical protein CK510_08780 [Brunnivagina elsteri CCALA 953]|uniref:Uncharacterized protein n=1 Tax=Brunnivagina elsteri CCALA 953 TaxID=987040 RepID=A0A2A2TKY5_9CYAN|nr:hypothetical protein CK510_08780 [Calothrix elsteri CCALA 953]
MIGLVGAVAVTHFETRLLAVSIGFSPRYGVGCWGVRRTKAGLGLGSRMNYFPLLLFLTLSFSPLLLFYPVACSQASIISSDSVNSILSLSYSKTKPILNKVQAQRIILTLTSTNGLIVDVISQQTLIYTAKSALAQLTVGIALILKSLEIKFKQSVSD